MSSTRSTGRTLVGGALAALLLLSAGVVHAGHDTAQEVQFWAFSRDGRFMLVVVKDEARGDSLAIKQVGKLASVHETQLPPGIKPEQLPMYLQYPPFNAYGFADPGTVGADAPNGAGTIMASPMTNQLQFFMGRGERMVKMFALPLGHSPDFTMYAKGEIKEVRWASTGRAVAVIVHQSMAGEYGMETDQLLSFDPTPYIAKLGPMAPAAPAKK